MAKQIIGVGTTADDGTGDTLRAAFVKVNANTTEIYDDLSVFLDGVITVNDEDRPYAWAVVDSEENILIGVDSTGEIIAKFPEENAYDFVAELGNNGLSAFGGGAIETTSESGYPYIWVMMDSDENVLLAIDINGKLTADFPAFDLPYDFVTELENNGLSVFSDGSLESSLETDYPYSWAIIDADDNLLLGVDESGKLIAESAEIAGIETDVTSQYVNIKYAIVDASESILYGVDDLGKFHCNPSDELKLSLGVISNSVTASDQTAANDTHIFSSQKVDDTTVLIAQNLSTQAVSTIITTDGVLDNLYATNEAAYFTHDGVAKWSKSPAFVPYRVMPTDSIVCWGDSLTSLVYTGKLDELIDIPIVNKGIGGQTSSQIAARAGAVPIVVEAVGGSIGTTITAVELSSISQAPLNDQNVQILAGSINGVPGILSRATGDVFSFTRSIAGDAIDTTGGVTFIPTLDGLDESIAFLWMGRNDYSQPATVLANLAATIGTLKPKGKRFIISSVLNGSGEVTGTSAHTDIVTNINSVLASTYPNNFVDVRQVLIDAYDSGDAQDVIDHDGDTVPASLRLDNIHINEAGAQIVADTVFNFAVSKGWF